MPSELNGIVVVDKPDGLSSARVVSRVKAIVGARKVGHTGTLDPFATGVLICCINRATRIARFLLDGDKAYVAEMVLGVETDTQDATGRVTAQAAVDGITAERVRDAARRFIGRIDQVPPVYSALKHRGTPLYKLARRGAAVEKPARPVRIDRLDILAVDPPRVRFSVACSAGTYVRTLCADLGRALGCGAHLDALRRTASCGFGIAAALDLDRLAELRDAGRIASVVISTDAALPSMPAVTVDAVLAGKIANGGKLCNADFSEPPPDGVAFKVRDPGGRLIAILERPAAQDGYNYCCVFPT